MFLNSSHQIGSMLRRQCFSLDPFPFRPGLRITALMPEDRPTYVKRCVLLAIVLMFFIPAIFCAGLLGLVALLDRFQRHEWLWLRSSACTRLRFFGTVRRFRNQRVSFVQVAMECLQRALQHAAAFKHHNGAHAAATVVLVGDNAKAPKFAELVLVAHAEQELLKFAVARVERQVIDKERSPVARSWTLTKL